MSNAEEAGVEVRFIGGPYGGLTKSVERGARYVETGGRFRYQVVFGFNAVYAVPAAGALSAPLMDILWCEYAEKRREHDVCLDAYSEVARVANQNKEE